MEDFSHEAETVTGWAVAVYGNAAKASRVHSITGFMHKAWAMGELTG